MTATENEKTRSFGSLTHCDRCGKEATVKTNSVFNIEMICLECCGAERSHHLFKYAREKETQEVENGNYNFEGIGIPSDLKVKYERK
tara:strand:- start:217 stop:477 length:261 start_codon:yes stop_codon:yes gene_type:complete